MHTLHGEVGMAKWVGSAGTCAAALLTLAVSGCATSTPSAMGGAPPGWAPPTDFRGEPASAVVDWLGEPDVVRRVSPDLLLYEWYGRLQQFAGGQVLGLDPMGGFFVKPDGTVVGPACWMNGVLATNVDQIVSILGPPTRLKRYRFFDAYTWVPAKCAGPAPAGARPGGVDVRLSLSVDKDGSIRGWS
jgi:hypothetical protein